MAMPPSRAPQIVSLAIAQKLLDRAAPPSAWGLSAEQFQIALERSAAQRFSSATPAAPPSANAVEKYLDTLNLSDLALASACSAGNSAAWDFFVANFRPELYRAARAVIGGSDAAESGARELADSIYAELYGLRESEGQRKSLLDYFHGRSKLTTWLRAILAQRHVDQFRRTRRMDSLDDNGDESSRPLARVTATNSTPDPEREKYLSVLQAVLLAALDALAPRERSRLAYYYVNDLTLVQIGKLLGEHEATVSRKLDRTRNDLRQHVEKVLREEKKLTDAQLRLCFEYAREEWPFDLTGALSARE